MATFTNQATLSYTGGITNSNVTVGEILEVLSATKTAITPTYAQGESVTYAVSFVNSGTTAINGLTLTDNLGAYVFDSSTLYPLTYNEDSLKFFINGVLQTTPTVTAGPPLTISNITIPAGANGILIYEATANRYAPLSENSTITNTATFTGGGLTESVSSSATVTARALPALTITKSVCPTVVTDNDTLTYTFVIQNTGNTPADAASAIVVSDTFNPILNDITVTLNGEAFPATSYTYDQASGVFNTTAGSVTVPAATYTQDENGEIITTPGVAVLTISGTV